MKPKDLERLTSRIKKNREKRDFAGRIAAMCGKPATFAGENKAWTIIEIDGHRALLQRNLGAIPEGEGRKLPRVPATVVELNGSRAALQMSAKRLMTVIPESKITGLDAYIDAGGALLSAKCPEATGEEYVAEVRTSGAQVRFRVNPSYLLDALAPKSEITVFRGEPNTPLVFSYDGGEYRLALMLLLGARRDS